MRFLQVLFQKRGNLQLEHEDIVKPSYEKLVESSLSRFKLSLDDLVKSEWHFLNNVRSRNRASPGEALEVLGNCLRLGLTDVACHLLDMALPSLPPTTNKFWSEWSQTIPLIETPLYLFQSYRHPPLLALASP